MQKKKATKNINKDFYIAVVTAVAAVDVAVVIVALVDGETDMTWRMSNILVLVYVHVYGTQVRL